MFNYEVNINRMFIKGQNGITRTEIWASVTNKKNCETFKKRIWWKDEKGVHHDDTSDLPIEIRKVVDNAWLEKRRKW